MFCNKFVNDHSSRGNVVRALAQWQCLVALHEATNALHLVMHIALYHPDGMAIKIVVNLPAFFVIVNSLFAHNVS